MAMHRYGPDPDPFARPDSADIVDMLADGTVRVLAAAGLDQFSVNAVARAVDLTPQAVNQRFRGPEGARSRTLRLVTHAFGQRWLGWVTPSLAADPPLVRLPETAAEVRGVQTWAALAELARGEAARGNADLLAVHARVREAERCAVHRALSRAAGRSLTPGSVGPLAALTTGLRAELTAPLPALDVAAATKLLVRAVADVIATG